jgi:Polyketide cyclase / dehydrase and lipid transport
MTKRFLFALILTACATVQADTEYPGLQVDVKRSGDVYTFQASFDTPLTECAAYHYLTDYEAAKKLPGVIESTASRVSSNRVRVERTADERVLFFHVRLHSVMEYTEMPFDHIAFTQISGDSRLFRGDWYVESEPNGSTLRFRGEWEPDTLIPLFIIDHFARNGLKDRFSAIAKLAIKLRDTLSTTCKNQQLARVAE